MTTTAAADQLAAHLRDRRAFDHGDQRCDAFAPCEDCAMLRGVVVEARHQARIPQQRKVRD